jgi:hypothetical protein
MPPIQKDTLKLNCFRAKHHTVDFMAADASTVNLATGCGMDVRVWKGDKCRMPTLLVSLCALLICMYFR